MHRINHPSASQNLFGAGKPGFVEKLASAQRAATRITAEWVNAIQEEIANAVEMSGQTLSTAKNQLAQAISIAAAGAGAANAISIRSVPIAATPPSVIYDVLQHNGTSWLPGKLTNANVASAAAIAVSKLYPGPAGHVLGMVGSVAAWVSDTKTSIRNTPVAATPPATYDVLTYSGGSYTPAKLTWQNFAAAAGLTPAKFGGGTAGDVLRTPNPPGSGAVWATHTVYNVSLPSVSHNLVVPGIETAHAIVFAPTAANPYEITGMQAVVSTNNSVRLAVNASSQVLTIRNNNAFSAAANRFITQTGSDVAIPAWSYFLLAGGGSAGWYVFLGAS